jgi:hypothetical protein
MEFALVDGSRSEPFAGGRGTCPQCGASMIAKCGPRVIHHWAHFSRRNCDPWWENETPWHRAWKAKFPEDCREISHIAPDGEIHRADIKTPTGIVVEIQNSPMTDAERISREEFYGNLVWVINGEHFKNNFDIYHRLPNPESEMAKDLIWTKARRHLHGANRGIFMRRSNSPKLGGAADPHVVYGRLYFLVDHKEEILKSYFGHHQYDWVRPRKTWLDARCPVYIDLGEEWLARLEIYDKTGLQCVRIVSKAKFVHDVMVETRATDIARRFYPFVQPQM